MEDLGLSQAVVNLLTRAISFCLPLLVGGCGFLPEWFLPAEKISRLQTNDALQSNLKDKKETISDKLKELNQQAPRLIEPVDALIEPISLNNLSKCKSIIGAREEVNAFADSSNYGERLSEDAWGRSIVGSPQLIVLHETVLGEMESRMFVRLVFPVHDDFRTSGLVETGNDRRGGAKVDADDERCHGVLS